MVRDASEEAEKARKWGGARGSVVGIVASQYDHVDSSQPCLLEQFLVLIRPSRFCGRRVLHKRHLRCPPIMKVLQMGLSQTISFCTMHFRIEPPLHFVETSSHSS